MSRVEVLARLEEIAATIDPALFAHPGSAALRHALYAAWPGDRLPLPRRQLTAWCRAQVGVSPGPPRPHAAEPGAKCGRGEPAETVTSSPERHTGTIPGSSGSDPAT